MALQISCVEMKMKAVFCFMFLLAVPLYGSAARLSMENLEVKKHLNSLNKPPLKSIKSPDGDIIDCVPMSDQPALDHLLLKNHTIQMKPNHHPKGLFRDKNVGKNEGPKPITQLWHMNGRCPEGTIPIRRTKKEDLLRASSIKSYGKKNHSSVHKQKSADLEPDLINLSGHQHAVAYVQGENYYGAKATINVWGPKIQQSNDFSLSQFWILGGSFASDLNTIEAGWQVYPDLYGDSNTRLFTYWTSDSYQATGCYNLLCSGFVQINNKIAMGASIYPISGYDSSQYEISILVWKDPEEGNWWMQLGDEYVGYWPRYLFSHLKNSATLIEWGGEVFHSKSDGQQTTTQMGSGHFPVEGFRKASYFRNIQVVDGSNYLRPPKDINTITQQSNCYNVQVWEDNEWGSYFYHGGPGRNLNCP